MNHLTRPVTAAIAISTLAATLACQTREMRRIAIASPPAGKGSPVSSASATLPPGYLIGPDDVLSIVFWREKDLTTDVTVRPDGRIALPLLNDVQAAGLTPDQLREKLIELAAKYIEEPSATVVVKQVNSRRVYITGNVAKQGPYNLSGVTTVIQLISMAGGLLEYADKDHIVVVHAEKRPDGQPFSDKVNYSQVMKQRNLRQNIELRPGDTVIVP